MDAVGPLFLHGRTPSADPWTVAHVVVFQGTRSTVEAAYPLSGLSALPVSSFSGTSMRKRVMHNEDGSGHDSGSSTPTTASQVYQGPFLVASNLTVKAIAASSSSGS